MLNINAQMVFSIKQYFGTIPIRHKCVSSYIDDAKYICRIPPFLPPLKFHYTSNVIWTAAKQSSEYCTVRSLNTNLQNCKGSNGLVHKPELKSYELCLGYFTASYNFLSLTDGASEALQQKWETHLPHFIFLIVVLFSSITVELFYVLLLKPSQNL